MLAKQIITGLLLLSLVGQVFQRLAIVTSYYLDTEAYAKNCVNKARPQMHCNGKCQLMKRLKQEENKDKQAPERRSFQDEVLSSKSFFLTIAPIVLPVLSHHTAYKAYIPAQQHLSVFHPPGIFVS
ncbi:MAG TPA: hypothetical protein VG842_02155 [Sediminibacterium sp.]|nr:hypothetical protein [Sediminibacterium sp.]